MSKILIGYSPYRNDLRQAKVNERLAAAPAAVSKELVKIQLSPISMMVILFALTLLLGGLYLWNYNKIATKGYILKRLEISRQELQDQGDLKTLSLSKAKAMNEIIASGAIDHMRKPGSVSYVFGDNVIAKAN